ncbi:hypothetical protein Tco_0773928 [Tanacetum coccineum]|uniref:Translocon at the inner envelope membrane of chloroplasts 214 n=1 Tax=Tanacetum coccineum TaxID=301880 RepID=A0ABQ4ZN40_9ASTR
MSTLSDLYTIRFTQSHKIIKIMILRRRKKKSLDYNNSFLGEYECSSLALDRDERRGEESRNEKEEIRSLKTKSNNVTDQEI